MTVNIKATEKDYIMFVNKKEFYDKALEMGYPEPVLFQEDLDDEDYETIKRLGKNISLFPFAANDEEQSVLDSFSERIKELKKDGIDSYLWLVVGSEGLDQYYDADEPTLEIILNAFPTLEEYEKRLMDHGIVLCRDFEDVCGNCNEFLPKRYKYCTQCGTERGKGEFKPYKNMFDCVYGPPVKVKSKCTACGHIWITGGLGGNYSKYCPECGKRTVNVLEDKVIDFTDYTFIGDPFDIDEKPFLFSEEEIIKLLQMRTQNEESIDDEGLLKCLREIGLDFPEKIVYEDMTELQGEQMSLASKILRLQGEKPGLGNCGHCGTTYVASYAYDLVDSRWQKIVSQYHNKAGNGLLTYERRMIQPEYARSAPAFLCLRCGEDIGTLEIDEDTLRKIEEAKQKTIC